MGSHSKQYCCGASCVRSAPLLLGALLQYTYLCIICITFADIQEHMGCSYVMWVQGKRLSCKKKRTGGGLPAKLEPNSYYASTATAEHEHPHTHILEWHCDFWLKPQATTTRFPNTLCLLGSMAPNHSKLGVLLWHAEDLPLEEISCFQECCDMLLYLETTEEPEEYVNISTLFIKYIDQQMQEMSGRQLWLCCFCYNQSEGTAWPGLSE